MSKEAPAYDKPPAGPVPPPDMPEDEPPAYELRPEGAGPDPDEILDPAVFVIHGRFIYLQSPSGEAESEPVYQLSRAIHSQGNATEKIEFQRLDLRVRTVSDGSPAVSKRAKDVYYLEHRKPLPYVGFPFQAWLEPQSRKTLGKVMIEKSPAFHAGYRAMRVVSDAEKRWLEKEGKEPVKKGEYHFALKDQGKTWQWSDSKGRGVASQVKDTKEQEQGSGEAEYRLKVLVPLSRRMRDGLVALWCLWMWHLRVEENTPRKKTWEDRKRILQMPRVNHVRTLF